MIRRIFSIICYSLFYALIIFLTYFYKQPLFIFVLMVLIVFPPASILVCRYCFARLTVSIDLKPSVTTSQNPISVSINLNNPTLFPLTDCAIEYTLSSSFYPCDKLRRIVCPAYSNGSFSFVMPAYFEKCGCYQLDVLRLEAYDYLHFFRFKKELSLRREITVYPKLDETLSFSPAAYGEGFDEYEESSAKGNISSNVTDIREYIPGDRLQKIHWKLSARVQKLMVKENEQTSSNQFTLMVELFQPDENSNALEISLSGAFSMGKALIAAGEPFYFTFYQENRSDFSTFLIRCEDDFLTALSECFYQTPYRQENLALQVQQRTGIFKGVLLHATHKGVEDVDF